MEKYFLGFDDPYFEENYKRAVEFIPDLQKTSTQTGIHQSHQNCAFKSITYKFAVLDADCYLLDNFNLSKLYELTPDYDSVYIFRAVNPVNGLVYGHGGIKVFDRRLFYNLSGIDMSTSFHGKIKIVKHITNIHRFNSTPFHAWRTAFRECVKLSSGVIKNRNSIDDEYRLTQWCEVFNNVKNAEYVKAGALAGREYGHKGVDIHLVNNFNWLKEKFNVLET